MKLNFETTDKEKSQVLLKITIDKSEIQSEYDKILSETQKKAQLQGFRKGKAPKSILESKFKDSFLLDAANNAIEKAFKEIIEKVKKKPLYYSMPKLENFELPKLDADYTFQLVYDTYPEYKFVDLKKIDVETNDIKITDDDVNKEIETHLKEFATIQAKDGKIEEKDIVNIEYTVYHEDKEFYKSDNEHIYMDKSYDMFKIGEDILGLKKDEEKEFTKTFSNEEIEKIAGKTFKIKLKIKEVKCEKIPELNDEMAQTINPESKTVEDLKNHIKEELIKTAENIKKNKVIKDALDKIIETFEGEIPESMVSEQTNSMYNQFINRLGGNEKKAEQFLKYQNLTVEKFKENSKENALKEIKTMLIFQQIIKNQNFEVTDDDIKEYLKPFVEKTKKNIDEVIEHYKKNHEYEYLKEDVKMKKAQDYVIDNIKVKTGKKISLNDFVKQNSKNTKED